MSLKQKIIAETRKLFSLKGYVATSINDILEACNISKGGLYNHFKSKEHLFNAVLEDARRIWRIRNMGGLEEIKSPVMKLIALINNYQNRYITDVGSFPGGCIFINLSIDLDDKIPQLAELVNRGFRGFKRLIYNLLIEAKQKNELKRNINIEEVCEIINAVLIGGAVSYSQEKSKQKLNKTISALENYIKSYMKQS